MATKKCKMIGCKREEYAGGVCAHHFINRLEEEKSAIIKQLGIFRGKAQLLDEKIPSEAEVWVRAYCAEIPSAPNLPEINWSEHCRTAARQTVKDYKEWREENDKNN